jgi:HlyD family secretion protein.
MSSQRQDIVAAAINRGPDDEPRGEFLLGFIVFCLFFIGFGVWSATASLRAAAVAPGQIVVVGHRQAVQHPEGGVVARLLVKENDRVEAGQVLLELSDTQVGSEAQRLTNSVASLQARRARLIAERDGASEVAEPEAFRAIADPDARQRAAVLMSEQRRLFAERRRARTTEAGVFQTRQDQLRQQKTGAISQIDAVKEQIRLIEDELAAVIDLEAKAWRPQRAFGPSNDKKRNCWDPSVNCKPASPKRIKPLARLFCPRKTRRRLSGLRSRPNCKK